MKKNLSIWLLFLCFFSIKAVIISVPGQYATIAQAAAAAQNGDVVQIAAGQYTGTGIIATWNQSNITIQGVNGKAHLNASGVNISNGKAIFVIRGNNVLLENIEFSSADVPDNNGAGIRYEGTGSLTVRNSYFHNNEMGILTGNLGTENITLEACEFHDHGKTNNGFSHNIYIGRGAKFTMKNCYSHDAYIGHNVKSRADENYILYNRIIDHNNYASGEASSYLIDLPEGGLSYVIGNELHQAYESDNSTAFSYARENQNGPLQILYFINNTFVNDRNNGIAISVGGSPNGKIVNNIFDNFTTVINGNFTGTVSNNANNVLFVNRTNFDYRLQSQSNGINLGANPGLGNGYDLTPTLEYVHPLSNKTRYSDGNLDIGALEYNNSSTLTDILSIKDFGLKNYPNPFNPQTQISFNLPKENYIKLSVYNSKGELVQTLIDNMLPSGNHNVKFDGSAFNSGVYFYRLEASDRSMIKKMLLLK